MQKVQAVSTREARTHIKRQLMSIKTHVRKSKSTKENLI